MDHDRFACRPASAFSAIAFRPTVSVHPYRRAWETRDLSQWEEALAEDVVLHSPVISRPFMGRDAALELFDVLFDVLDAFQITHELANGESHAFFWRADANGRNIQGTDLIRHDAQGKICEVTVMIRPLVDIAAFAAAIGPPLAARRGRYRAPLVRLMTLPLRVFLALADTLASRLIG